VPTRAYRLAHPEFADRERKANLERNRRYGKERMTKNMDRWRRNNPEKARDVQRRFQWKRQGIDPDKAKALRDSRTTCDICGSDIMLAVDHDHNTGLIRGVLCRRCNQALGALGDSVESIERVLAYLRRAYEGQQ